MAKKQDGEPRVIRSGICVARRPFLFLAAVTLEGNYSAFAFSDGEAADFKEWSRPSSDGRIPGFEVTTANQLFSCHMPPSWFEDKFKVWSGS